MHKELIEKARKLLGNNLISVLAIGTAAIEEDFIKDWSDYDICFVVKKKTKDIQNKVSKLELNNDYLISIITEDQIIPAGLWPFNDKFRTKCLYGKEIFINLPSTNEAKTQLRTYIGIQGNKLFSRVANFEFWTDKKVKKEAYKLIKHILFSYAVYNFLQNGVFLKSRREIYAKGSESAKKLCVLLHNWKDVKREQIDVEAMENVVKEIKEFCK